MSGRRLRCLVLALLQKNRFWAIQPVAEIRASQQRVPRLCCCCDCRSKKEELILKKWHRNRDRFRRIQVDRSTCDAFDSDGPRSNSQRPNTPTPPARPPSLRSFDPALSPRPPDRLQWQQQQQQPPWGQRHSRRSISRSSGTRRTAHGHGPATSTSHYDRAIDRPQPTSRRLSRAYTQSTTAGASISFSPHSFLLS